MFQTFMILILDAVFSFLPILFVFFFVKWTKILGGREYIVPVCGFCFGGMSYLFSYLFATKVFLVVIGGGEVEGTLLWLAYAGVGSVLYYLVLSAIVGMFLKIPAWNEGGVTGGARIYLYSLALGTFAAEFVDDAKHFVEAMRHLIEFAVDRPDPVAFLEDVDFSMPGSLLLPVATCLWLVFLTLTTFVIHEEVVRRRHPRYLGLSIYSISTALGLFLLLEAKEEFLALSLAGASVPMLRYYRYLRNGGGIRPGRA